MALHEVNSEDMALTSKSYISDMLEQFIESEMKAAEIDVPITAQSTTSFRSNVHAAVRRKGFNDKIRIRQIKDKIYLIKK